jgi:putative hydrolase of the HAD superfamily
MSAYKHIFFDLDRTLWDMDGNSYQTLCELSNKHKILEKGISSVDEFIARYKVINTELWEDYSHNRIDKETLRFDRFRRAFEAFNITDAKLSETFANDYVAMGPLKNNLLPHAIEVLDYLFPRYEMHIITNGFEEVQKVKIERSGLGKYFKNVITSEMAGYKKPDPKIFHYSMQLAESTTANSLMVGDSLEADILGSKNSGMPQVFFNPEKIDHNVEVTHEIHSLKELQDIL